MTKGQRFSVINLGLPVGARVNPGDLGQAGGRAACAWTYAYDIDEGGGPTATRRIGEHKRRRWFLFGI